MFYTEFKHHITICRYGRILLLWHTLCLFGRCWQVKMAVLIYLNYCCVTWLPDSRGGRCVLTLNGRSQSHDYIESSRPAIKNQSLLTIKRRFLCSPAEAGSAEMTISNLPAEAIQMFVEGGDEDFAVEIYRRGTDHILGLMREYQCPAVFVEHIHTAIDRTEDDHILQNQWS